MSKADVMTRWAGFCKCYLGQSLTTVAALNLWAQVRKDKKQEDGVLEEQK